MYWIYSATKVITCTAVMQLIEQGKIGLYDNLDKYLPEFANMSVMDNGNILPQFGNIGVMNNVKIRPAKRKIRIFDLLTMQSGLTYNFRTEEIDRVKQASNNKASTREIIRALAASPLAFDPSERWMYSLSHDVLAVVVETVTGKRFGQYLKESIFEPLGMTDITFSMSPEQRKRLSAQYQYDFKTKEFKLIGGDNMFVITDEYESGGAGLACTVNAYGLFVDAMCNNGVGANGARILSSESIEQMRTNRLTGQSLEDFKKGGKAGYGYGLGVRTLIDKSKSKGPLKEFGWDGAACAYVLIDSDNNLGIYMAMHTLMFVTAYFEIHPTVRDLTYEALSIGS
jgi:CubicO group peptidase (beta-lactamase class C family)